MPRHKKILFHIMPLGNRRAVALASLPTESYVIEFQRPIQGKSDMQDGKPAVQARTRRCKNQLITQIKISGDAARALKLLCSKWVKNPSLQD